MLSHGVYYTTARYCEADVSMLGELCERSCRHRTSKRIVADVVSDICQEMFVERYFRLGSDDSVTLVEHDSSLFQYIVLIGDVIQLISFARLFLL